MNRASIEQRLPIRRHLRKLEEAIACGEITSLDAAQVARDIAAAIGKLINCDVCRRKGLGEDARVCLSCEKVLCLDCIKYDYEGESFCPKCWEALGQESEAGGY